MLHQLLKEATKPDHEGLEKLMFVNEIMNGSLTLAQYKRILTTNYAIHKAFEDDLLDHLNPALAEQLNIDHRYKLAALETDMQELKLPANENKFADVSFEINDASILGAMYVMEGATLGGSVIVKRLQTNPQLNSLGLNFNYYKVYGDNLIPYWKIFCEVLNQQPESAYPAALKSAHMMFGCIARLQQQNNQLS